MSTPDYPMRINKLDSFFLWVASLSGLGFTIFISFLRVPVDPYLPIFVIIAVGLFIGYLNGAVFCDSFTNRMRGWNFVLVGLAIYAPLAAIKFSEGYLTSRFPNYATFETPLSVIAELSFIIIYLIGMIKITPKVYISFGLDYGVVTKRILNRTTISSVLLGISLFIFVSGLQFNLITFILFMIVTVFLLSPITIQEKRIKKLSPLEKYQDCIHVEPLENKSVFNFFMGVMVALSVLLLVVNQLPRNNFQLYVIQILALSIIVSVFGLLFGILYSDKGDMVRIKDTLPRTLTEPETEELNTIVTSANS